MPSRSPPKEIIPLKDSISIPTSGFKPQPLSRAASWNFIAKKGLGSGKPGLTINVRSASPKPPSSTTSWNPGIQANSLLPEAPGTPTASRSRPNSFLLETPRSQSPQSSRHPSTSGTHTPGGTPWTRFPDMYPPRLLQKITPVGGYNTFKVGQPPPVIKIGDTAYERPTKEEFGSELVPLIKDHWYTVMFDEEKGLRTYKEAILVAGWHSSSDPRMHITVEYIFTKYGKDGPVPHSQRVHILSKEKDKLHPKATI